MSSLLVVDGRLTAVIDRPPLICGDPAYDLVVAWHMLPKPTRERFRQELCVDGDLNAVVSGVRTW